MHKPAYPFEPVRVTLKFGLLLVEPPCIYVVNRLFTDLHCTKSPYGRKLKANFSEFATRWNDSIFLPRRALSFLVPILTATCSTGNRRTHTHTHVFYRYYLLSRKEDLALAPQPMSQKWEPHALSSQRWLGLQSLTHDTNDASGPQCMEGTRSSYRIKVIPG